VSGRLRVLVVDDSALVRQMFVAILGRERDIEVRTASNGAIALLKMREARPDVVVLDLEMPTLDGRTFLRRVMAESPLPVVVCSALTERGTDAAIGALVDGAIEVMAKPRVGLREFLEDSALTLIATVRAAAAARIAERRTAHRGPLEAPRVTDDRVIAIGASTGGPEALRVLLAAMPRNAPPIVVVQHMPELFTSAFARQLDASCAIRVTEARPGDRLARGSALIAPGGRHLCVRRSGDALVADVIDGPRIARHRPSVDVLFESVALNIGARAIGVLLTGMGADGARGLLAMRRAGASTIAQSEATSVVFGMPREAISLGAAERVLPLSDIAAATLAAGAR